MEEQIKRQYRDRLSESEDKEKDKSWYLDKMNLLNSFKKKVVAEALKRVANLIEDNITDKVSLFDDTGTKHPKSSNEDLGLFKPPNDKHIPSETKNDTKKHLQPIKDESAISCKVNLIVNDIIAPVSYTHLTLPTICSV
eukprot:TRINITY_DN11162_c0_g1_i3.p2 TRINITY_DN11162_c0_g1~~TRINITY_DN11162_c0_g1_i3.p2  ORF type:complete len:139 (+),score=35.97 TRINITY_DN11162_c0_g1_i3:170-586(+)